MRITTFNAETITLRCECGAIIEHPANRVRVRCACGRKETFAPEDFERMTALIDFMIPMCIVANRADNHG